MSTTSATTEISAPPAARAGRFGGALARLAALAGDALLQKSALSVGDQAIVSGTSFATSVILGRMCAQEELGVYYLALSIVYFARGIQEQLVSAPYTIYSGRRQGAELARYAGSSLIHQCVLLVVTSGVLALLAICHVLPQGLQGAVWLLLGATPLLLMREYIRQLLFAHLDLRAAIGLDVSVAILQMTSLAVLSATSSLSLVTTLAVLAASSGLPAAWWIATSGRHLIVELRTALADFWHNWTFARWALASQLLACTTPYVMPWVVALTHGEAQTGMLGACSTLVGLSNMFMLGLCNFLSPKAARAFAEGGVSELRTVLRKTAALFLVSLGAIAVIGFVFGEAIAAAVYGESFANTGWLVGVLSLSVLANSMGVTAGNGLWAMERPSANFFADLIALAVVIVATICFVPLWGPLGAALATLCGTSSDAAIRLWILRRTMHEMAAVGRAAA
jgi:O-antigen/teichoic acid export membrane protein